MNRQTQEPDPPRPEPDRPDIIVHPPIALAAALLAGFGLQRLHPLPVLPPGAPGGWLGGALFALGFALALWAALTFRAAGTALPTFRPASVVVAQGPYRYSRNPIYLGMFLGLAGLALMFDSGWLLIMLVPFALAIRYAVVAREEAYLSRKFGAAYLDYAARVRRWG